VCGEQFAAQCLLEGEDMHFRILSRLLGVARVVEGGHGRPVDAESAYAADCYRYLLRTAPPGAIERAHTEALRQLSAAQRHQLAWQLRPQLQDHTLDEEPRALARLLTCAELRHPGALEHALGAGEPSLFHGVARAFTATPIAQQFLGGIDYDGQVTEPWDHTYPEQELDYEDTDYETPPLEYFLDRSDAAS
jgi:hypothetical protein